MDPYAGLRWESPDDIRAVAMFSAAASAYRFRNDDGSETGATWKAAQNTNPPADLDADVNFRVRFRAGDVGGASGTLTPRLYFQIGTGAWTAANGTTAVKLVSSAQVSNGTATTSQLTGNGVLFTAGQVRHDNSHAAVSLIALQNTEAEWVVQLDSAQLTDGNTVNLQIANGTTRLTEVTASCVVDIPAVLSPGSVATAEAFGSPSVVTPDPDGHFLLDGDGDYLWTADKAQLDITNEVDVRVRLDLTNRTPAASANMGIASKWLATGDQRSYQFRWVEISGTWRLLFAWSVDGVATTGSINSVSFTLPSGAFWVRAHLIGDTGTQRELRFYSATVDNPGPGDWTQIGTTNTGTSSSIFSGSAELRLGHVEATGFWFAGKIYACELFDATTRVANPDFRTTAQADWSTGSGSDDDGNTWTAVNAVYVAGDTGPTISPGGIATGEAFGGPTVTAGAVAVSPGGAATAEAFGGPTISLVGGPQNVSPGGIATGEAFGGPQILPGGVSVSPGGIPTGEAFGTAQATTGPVTVSPGGIATGEAFGTAAVSTAGATLAPGGIPTGEAFGTAAVSTAGATISPGSIAPSGYGEGYGGGYGPDTFGFPAVVAGAVTASPEGITTTEAFGGPSVTAGATVSPGGVPTGETFGAVTLSPGSVTATPTGVPTGEAFGGPTVTISGVDFVLPGGIATGEAFGGPAVGSAAAVAPGGIATGEAFGSPVLTQASPQTVTPGGVATAEAFGGPVVVSVTGEGDVQATVGAAEVAWHTGVTAVDASAGDTELAVRATTGDVAVDWHAGEAKA